MFHYYSLDGSNIMLTLFEMSLDSQLCHSVTLQNKADILAEVGAFRVLLVLSKDIL